MVYLVFSIFKTLWRGCRPDSPGRHLRQVRHQQRAAARPGTSAADLTNSEDAGKLRLLAPPVARNQAKLILKKESYYEDGPDGVRLS